MGRAWKSLRNARVSSYIRIKEGEDMANAGAFLQNFVSGLQQGQELKLKRDYMESQKKLLDSQIKAADAEAQHKAFIANLISGIFPTGGGMPATQTGTQGVPSTAPATAPQTGGLPGLIAASRTNPLIGGVLKKEIGVNPGAITWQHGIAGPGGQPTTIGMDITGAPIPGLAYPEAMSPEQANFAGNELLKKTLTQLPELRTSAISASNMSGQIDKAMELVNAGATGKMGQLKAAIAPYAEMFGIESKSLSEAQTYQLLTRAIIGPMRLDIIGPGPVSEWEQKLMQQISGGGAAAKDAATMLLGYWKKVAGSKMQMYNDTLEGISKRFPDVGTVYQPVKVNAVSGKGLGKAPPALGVVEKTIGGKTYFKKGGKWYEK